MEVIGNPCEMKENNPVCFDETMVGAAGITISPDSFLSDNSWIASSKYSHIKSSMVGDNIFYMDRNLIMESGSEFKGSLFSRGREDSELHIFSTKINANITLMDTNYLNLTGCNIEGNLIVKGEGRFNCIGVNIFGNVIIDLPKGSSIDLVYTEIHGDLILSSEGYLRMGECSIFGFNTIRNKGNEDLRMEKCHYNNSGYNEYYTKEDTKWIGKIVESKFL